MSTARTRRRVPAQRAVAAAGVVLLGVSGAVLALGPASGNASSHREAPLIAGDPKADNTDVYSFVSPDNPKMTTIVANWIPFEEPNGGPNFYPFATNAHYNLKIDNSGTGNADLTYQWTFTDHYKHAGDTFLYNDGPVTSLDSSSLNFTQTYDLDLINGKTGNSTKLVSGAIAAPSNVGHASIPSYANLRSQATHQLPGGGQEYVGQADDPFFLDLRVFDLLYGGNLSEAGHDTLCGYNVNTIDLQVPTANLALNGNASRNPVIGVWATTERQSTTVAGGGATPGAPSVTGKYVQVSRLGNPLVNEVVVPLQYKDAFNAIPPSSDHTVKPVVDKVTNPIVPMLLQKLYKLPAPATPRNDLVEIFLTGVAKNAPTLDGSKPPIQADLNSQVLNKDVSKSNFVPSEEERLNTSVPVTSSPNRLGVLAGDLQGFPNGRRLTDDVVDIELQALEGAAQSGKLVSALMAGDGVNTNSVPFSNSFPYIALPNTQAVNQGCSSASGSPSGGVASGQGGESGLGGFARGVDTTVATAAALGAMLLVGAGGMSLRKRRNGAS